MLVNACIRTMKIPNQKLAHLCAYGDVHSLCSKKNSLNMLHPHGCASNENIQPRAMTRAIVVL